MKTKDQINALRPYLIKKKGGINMRDESQQQHKTGSLFVESDSRKEPRAIDNKAPRIVWTGGEKRFPPRSTMWKTSGSLTILLFVCPHCVCPCSLILCCDSTAEDIANAPASVAAAGRRNHHQQTSTPHTRERESCPFR